jgi:butyryl-CoA dehydrogenase
MSQLDRRDLAFLLYEVLDVGALSSTPRYADQDRATWDAVLEAAATLATEKFAPFAAKLDANEPELVGERVVLIPEVKEAVDAFVAAGFVGAAFDHEDGGMQLPWTIAQVCAAEFKAANIAAVGYPYLTIAAANLLKHVGSAQQKARYLAPMIAGRWFGTMVLSEPQAGSSVGDVRTRAEPDGEGRYLLRGNKMWTSCADHELSENIIHFVLARLPDAPAGVRGLSLFLVPKFHVSADGSPGARNDVRVAGLNHKMGYRGTVNAVFNLGERGECVGELVGAPHEGLAGMFHMMNEMRISVGLGAVALGYAGYRHSLAYARERPQGRLPGEKDPASPQVPIIRHADIKRLLLAQKAAVEGGLMLNLYCAHLVDVGRAVADEAVRERAARLLNLLTPVAKSWPSEFCLEANKHAIQILGGYGYTREFPLERLYRDNRLNHIHEGTHGIHGIDLLGRRLGAGGGAAFRVLQEAIAETIGAARAHGELVEYCRQVEDVLATLTAVATRLLALQREGAATLALANATIFLDAFGHVVVAWLWLEQARVAAAALPAAQAADRAFYAGKLAACRYFHRYELSRVPDRLALLARADDTCLAMQDGWF